MLLPLLLQPPREALAKGFGPAAFVTLHSFLRFPYRITSLDVHAPALVFRFISIQAQLSEEAWPRRWLPACVLSPTLPFEQGVHILPTLLSAARPPQLCRNLQRTWVYQAASACHGDTPACLPYKKALPAARHGSAIPASWGGQRLCQCCSPGELSGGAWGTGRTGPTVRLSQLSFRMLRCLGILLLFA